MANKISNSLTIFQNLTECGWTRYKSYHGGEKEYWAKRYFNAPRCKCNDDREGIQIIIKVWEIENHTSYTIELRAQKPDNAWVNLEVYSLNGELLDVMDEQIRQLISVWTMLAN